MADNDSFVVGLQVVGIVSVLSSLAVVLTLCFQSLRKKLFMQIIACIAFSDMIANLGYCSERRANDNTPICTLEGFVNIYFYPVSWLWTTVLMVLLYSLATSGKLPFTYLSINILCWVFPFVLTIFNFAAPSSERSTKASGQFKYELCTLGGFSDAQKLYHVLSYYGLWIACVVAMCVMYAKIRSIGKIELTSNFPMWQSARDTLILYPLSLLLCWIPHLVAVTFAYYAPFSGINVFYFVADSIKILHGTVTAVIFFYKSGEARSRWMKLFVSVAVGLGLMEDHMDEWTVVTDFSVEYDSQAGSVDRTASVDGLRINAFLNDDTMEWASGPGNRIRSNSSGGGGGGGPSKSTGRVISSVGNRLHSGERNSEVEIC